MGKRELTAQQVATCVRISLVLWSGRVGPQGFGGSFGRLDFARNDDFILDIAADLRMEAADVWRMLRDAEEEGVEVRRRRGEAIEGAEKVCSAVAYLRKNYGERWAFFQKMVRGQTLTQLSRSVAKSDRGVARASCSWCAGVIEERVGVESLERILTFREVVG